MNDEYFAFQLETRREKTRSKVNAGRFGALQPRSYLAETGFKCGHCHVFISAEAILSGVNNRNHCPYCLWSKHLDLYQAGDRLAACKSLMRPVGLALKRTRKKYGEQAADDDVGKAWVIFAGSPGQDGHALKQVGESGVDLLGLSASELVRTRLFGRSTSRSVAGAGLALDYECEGQNDQ